MSDIPTKTYPPEFLHALISDHEAEQAGATPEASSAVETKGDAMSEIQQFTIYGPCVVTPAVDGEWIRYDDHLVEVERMREDAERYRWLGYGPEFDRAVDEGRRKSSQEGGRDE